MKLILDHLYYLSFAMHYAFVMLVLGVPLLAFVEAICGKSIDGRATVFLKRGYPVCVSLSITAAVAVFLFSQVMRHKVFYNAFLSLNPLPLLLIVLLIVFFYLAYIAGRLQRFLVPVLALMIGIAFLTVVFFSQLFAAMHLQGVGVALWFDRFVYPSWPMIPVHFGAGLVGSLLFLWLKDKHIWFASVLLLLMGAGMTVFREHLRNLATDHPLPLLLTTIDPSFWVFAGSFVVMLGVLVWVRRVVGR